MADQRRSSARRVDGFKAAPPGVRLHQLEGFFHVARHQGYARAVEALPYAITEPALHQQVRKLEAALGVKLLKRAAGRRMVPTAAGRGLLRFIEPYFDQLPAVLRNIAMGEAGVLIVATESLYVEELCAPVLAMVRSQRPGAEFSLLERDVSEIFADLRSAKADVGIISHEGPIPAGLQFDVLGQLGLQLLVPKGHRLARKRSPLLPRDFAGERLVVYPRGSDRRAYTEQTMLQAKLKLHIAAETSTASSMRAMVRAGVGPAFVPALRTEKHPAQRRQVVDGCVAFDVTHLLEEISGLLDFGIVRREGPMGSMALVEAFCTAAEEQLQKRQRV